MCPHLPMLHLCPPPPHPWYLWWWYCGFLGLVDVLLPIDICSFSYSIISMLKKWNNNQLRYHVIKTMIQLWSTAWYCSICAVACLIFLLHPDNDTFTLVAMICKAGTTVIHLLCSGHTYLQIVFSTSIFSVLVHSFCGLLTLLSCIVKIIMDINPAMD